MISRENTITNQTCFLVTFLQKWSLTVSSFFSCTGSLRGKRIGNQENMPGEWVAGRMEIMIFL